MCATSITFLPPPLPSLDRDEIAQLADADFVGQVLDLGADDGAHFVFKADRPETLHEFANEFFHESASFRYCLFKT